MKQKITNVLNWLMAAMFLNAGLNKIFNYIPPPPDLPEAMVKDFAAFIEIEWLFPLVAVTEIVGAFLIILKQTRPLGTLVLFPVVIGIALVHFIVEPSGIIISIIILALIGWNLWMDKNKFLSLVKA
ncbi:MAG: DoxX family membrane protein [Chryseotalea sp.]